MALFCKDGTYRPRLSLILWACKWICKIQLEVKLIFACVFRDKMLILLLGKKEKLMTKISLWSLWQFYHICLQKTNYFLRTNLCANRLWKPISCFSFPFFFKTKSPKKPAFKYLDFFLWNMAVLGKHTGIKISKAGSK